MAMPFIQLGVTIFVAGAALIVVAGVNARLNRLEHDNAELQHSLVITDRLVLRLASEQDGDGPRISTCSSAEHDCTITEAP